MVDIYKAHRTLFKHEERLGRMARRERLAKTTSKKVGKFQLKTADAGKIEALRALRDELQRIASAIEEAVFDLQNKGEVNDDLSRALSIANHCAAGASQLLVAALDGSEAIRAAKASMEKSIEALGKIKTDTEELIKDLGGVTSVLTTAGKLLELIDA